MTHIIEYLTSKDLLVLNFGDNIDVVHNTSIVPLD